MIDDVVNFGGGERAEQDRLKSFETQRERLSHDDL